MCSAFYNTNNSQSVCVTCTKANFPLKNEIFIYGAWQLNKLEKFNVRFLAHGS